jgi:hypothetical protein
MAFQVSANLSNPLPSLYGGHTKKVTGVSKPGEAIEEAPLGPFTYEGAGGIEEGYKEGELQTRDLTAFLRAQGATPEKVKELDTALGEAGPDEIDAAGGTRGFLEMLGKGLVDTFNVIEPFLPEISAASYKGPGFGIKYGAKKPGKKGTRTARLGGGPGSDSVVKLKESMTKTLAEKEQEAFRIGEEPGLPLTAAEQTAQVPESGFDKRDLAAVANQAATAVKDLAGVGSVNNLKKKVAKAYHSSLADMPPDGGGGLGTKQVASLAGARDGPGAEFVRQQQQFAGTPPSATGRQIELVRTPEGLMQRVNGVLRPLGPGVYDTMGGTANV